MQTMKSVLLCLISFSALVAVCLAAYIDNGSGYPSLDKEWKHFKDMYRKKYSSHEEDCQRKKTFEANYAYVKKHNKEAKHGKHTFDCAINEYSDLSAKDFINLMTGLKLPGSLEDYDYDYSSEEEASQESRAALPASIDWRTKGYVTGIKNQGQCGACWTFAAVGALEGQNFRATGKLVSLSEQNLVDCALGKSGCNGGFLSQAFQYVQTNGIDTSAAYPYQQAYGGCRFQKNGIGGTASGMVNITRGSEAALQQAVATVGPVAVCIDASRTTFQHYKSGIYYDPSCTTTNLVHAVTTVGYGTENGQDYWIMKNSWGEGWGNKGYILMSRNHNNHCGVATLASYPIVSATRG